MDILDVNNFFANPILEAGIDLERLIVQYVRQCPSHQNDERIGYIVSYANDYPTS